jgi:hypothetical protein
MDLLFEDPDKGHKKNKTCTDRDWTQPGGTDTSLQLAISLLLGFSAFFAFCVSVAARAISPLLLRRSN